MAVSGFTSAMSNIVSNCARMRLGGVASVSTGNAQALAPDERQ
jgi:hypothetical protein